MGGAAKDKGTSPHYSSSHNRQLILDRKAPNISRQTRGFLPDLKADGLNI